MFAYLCICMCIRVCVCMYWHIYCVRGVCVHALVGRSQKTTSLANSILQILSALVLVFGLLRLFLLGVVLVLFVLFLFFETESLIGLELIK